MDINAQKLEKLRVEIEKDSEKEAETLVSDARKNAEKSIDGKKESLRKAYESDVARITEEFRAAEKKRISEKRFSEARGILAYRGELTDRFFAEIEEELTRITASPEYEGYLKRCAEKAGAYSPLSGSVTAYCRPEDIAAVKKALSSYGVKIQESEDMRLGGILFRYGEQSAFADFTLDTALEQEREAFASMKEMQI